VIIGRNGESGVLRMAQAIARRHARIGAIARSVPFVLRRVGPFSVNHFHVVRPCSFAPRLSFHLTSNRSTERVEKLVGGIRERFIRVPMVIEPHRASAESSDRPSASGLPSGMRAGATERVFAKSAVALPAAPSLPADTSATPIAIPVTRTAAAMTPAPDVNRLANEVLQVIDKRIIAYRERAGRR